MVSCRRPRYVVAGVEEGRRHRRVGGGRGTRPIERRCKSPVAQQPKGLLWNRTHPEIGASEQRAGRGEAVAQVVRGALREWNEHASIVVSDVRDAAAVVGQQPGREGKPRGGALE